MTWAGRILLALVLIPATVLALDYLVWAARGFPTGQVDINVFTVMELKGQKEDYGEPDVQSRLCNRRVFSTGAIPTYTWLAHHRDIVQRP